MTLATLEKIMADNELGVMATQLLRGGAKALREASVQIVVARRQLHLASEYGAPNFVEKTETLRQQVDNLETSIQEVVPETEKHDGVRRLMRDELTPKEKARIIEIKGSYP
jgi:hypothetical protein